MTEWNWQSSKIQRTGRLLTLLQIIARALLSSFILSRMSRWYLPNPLPLPAPLTHLQTHTQIQNEDFLYINTNRWIFSNITESFDKQKYISEIWHSINFFHFLVRALQRLRFFIQIPLHNINRLKIKYSNPIPISIQPVHICTQTVSIQFSQHAQPRNISNRPS